VEYSTGTRRHISAQNFFCNEIAGEKPIVQRISKKSQIFMYIFVSQVFLKKLICTSMYFFVIILNISLSDKATNFEDFDRGIKMPFFKNFNFCLSQKTIICPLANYAPNIQLISAKTFSLHPVHRLISCQTISSIPIYQLILSG
jgi:hypothetical protein